MDESEKDLERQSFLKNETPLKLKTSQFESLRKLFYVPFLCFIISLFLFLIRYLSFQQLNAKDYFPDYHTDCLQRLDEFEFGFQHRVDYKLKKMCLYMLTLCIICIIGIEMDKRWCVFLKLPIWILLSYTFQALVHGSTPEWNFHFQWDTSVSRAAAIFDEVHPVTNWKLNLAHMIGYFPLLTLLYTKDLKVVLLSISAWEISSLLSVFAHEKPQV